MTGVNVTPSVQYNSVTVAWLALAGRAVTYPSSNVVHSSRGAEPSGRRGRKDEKDQSLQFQGYINIPTEIPPLQHSKRYRRRLVQLLWANLPRVALIHFCITVVSGRSRL